MKEKLKKNFKKYEDLLIYLGGSMLAIFLAVLGSYTGGNMTIPLIISTVNTVLIFSLIVYFVRKGGD